MPDRPGWYPDPDGVHDLRFFNGSAWTGDVSTNGERSVQPLGAVPSAQRAGTVPLVLGVISMSLGWIPFVCFGVAAVAIAAVLLGVRRRRDSADAATAGIVTGAVGVAFCAVGIWITIALVAAVARFEDPGAHTAELQRCEEVDGVTRATGSIRNDSTGVRSYTITVSFDGEQSGVATLDDVPAGATEPFVIDEDFRFSDLDCAIDSVRGPRPFGLPVD